MTRSPGWGAPLLATLCLTALAAAPLGAVTVPERTSPVAERELRHPDLNIRNGFQRLGDLPEPARAQALRNLANLGVPAGQARLDVRGGRWGTLILTRPLIPGRGNHLTWEGLGAAPPATSQALGEAAWSAFAGFVTVHRDQLGLEIAEMSASRRVTVQEDGDLVHIFAPRTVGGVRVRDSYVTAVIRHGNLVLMGASNWGDLRASTQPRLTPEEAEARAQAHLEPHTIDGSWGKTELTLVPVARGGQEVAGIPVGQGYGHRLTWVVRPSFAGELARYELLVDAHTGEVLVFEDTNHYATTRKVVGGVLPVTNDGVAPDGVEQPGWPMPFADVSTAICGNGVCEPGAGEDCVSCAADCNGTTGGNPNNRFCCGDGDGPNPVGCGDPRCTSGGFACDPDTQILFTDSGGNLLACIDGTIRTTLAGRFMRMSDACGPIDESSTGDIDLGTSPGTDCNVAPGASPGNTRASRSGFFEMNRIKEQARGWLPDNAWLQQQLTANMNINDVCNAFWNGSTVNFFRSGTSGTTFCSNTGEIAAVYDHEWGHGMDNNDAVPTISNPGEGIPDVYAGLRLDTSCIGRNFRPAVNCGGYGDPCIDCSGVRDIDWANRASGLPHRISGPAPQGLDALCGGGSSTPCGGASHCEGAAYSEANWDLAKRDLPAAGFDLNAAREMTTRLAYLGGGMVGNWFQCVANFGGCNADGGYLNYLAADDDDGDLTNGTPHMTAIFDAFNRHEIACDTPVVQNGGCAGAPTAAPVVTANPVDRGVELSWGAVAGATRYQIFRTDGVFACDFGKAKVGETTGTSFIDGGLLNGHGYSYVVVPIGGADTCFGPASSCVAVTAVAGPNLLVDGGSATLGFTSGDGDMFLDNCEMAKVTLPAVNIGTGTLNNVRIVAITPSNPGITIKDTLPIPASPSVLAPCDTGTLMFELTAGGLSFNEEVGFQIDVTSDELSPRVVTGNVRVKFAESDFQRFATLDFTFEGGVEGWQVVEGTFDRTSSGGGAEGTTWYEASSSFLDNQCDHIRSPVIGLTSTSTLSLWNQFDIEPAFQGTTWYDRANVGLFDTETDTRTPVNPDGGRLYNADGPNGTCGTTGQEGWADAATTWDESTWSATALNAGALAGKKLQLDVRYGTDPAANGFGFHFDQVTLSDVDLLVADTLTDDCAQIPVCGDGVCDTAGGEDQCTCAADCGAPPASEVPNSTCDDGIDNDCDGVADCDDTADCSTDPFCATGGFCGDGVCDTTAEDCVDCPQDCNGVQSGRPANRFCCGDGGGQNPVDCTDARCSEGTFVCQ